MSQASAQRAAGGVLLVLAAAQFLMVLDTSVMKVSIATGAGGVGTTITGIQSAITLFTLTMATLMLTCVQHGHHVACPAGDRVALLHGQHPNHPAWGGEPMLGLAQQSVAPIGDAGAPNPAA